MSPISAGGYPLTEALSDLSPSSLAVAIKTNLYAFFKALRHSLTATVLDRPYGFQWHTALPHPWFNGILCTQPPAENATQVIGDVKAYFQSRNIANFSWWLAPHLEPTAWAEHLLPHGFQYDNQTPGMAIDLIDLPTQVQNPLVIRRVEDRQALIQWVHTFVQGFELPEAMAPGILALFDGLKTNLPIRHFLGYIEDEPVAVSTLFIGAGVAGIYDVATLAAARGQGIGSAMTLAPLYEARQMGCRVGILQSSKMGYNIYQRLGFHEYCQIDHFYWQAEHSAEGSEANLT
jgi:GNAT superfamily N-acetyltransferase